LKDQGFDISVGFYDDSSTSRSQYLVFQLAMYHMNGTFLGFTELRSQMSPCPMTFTDVLNQRKFGTMTQNDCSFYLYDLISSDLPQGANIFYELYLQDSNGNFIDVPVLIRNYKLAGSGESYPNKEGMAVTDNWRLVRRFVIYDTISGIEDVGGYIAGATPKYVRWANDVKIKIEMDFTQKEAIYRPYVMIDYREKLATVIEQSTTIPVSFTLEYFSNYSSKITSIMIGFIFMNILAVVVALVRFYFYTQRNPKAILGHSAFRCYVFKFVYHMVDIWSELMFWTLFFSCTSIFIAYKLSMSAILLLPELGTPSEPEYFAFSVVIGITILAKTLAIVMRIVE